ncbi:hypothetical protein IFM89_018141 [Coptis chinensis]|uniref:Uncharacterized protein n=1 Tax=Coptis chinensis TaxID=261450 RepID=A0A835HTN0_9MAGN|nr:hypothetical protein IFM89_018141 [Coptis chinensis]
MDVRGGYSSTNFKSRIQAVMIASAMSILCFEFEWRLRMEEKYESVKELRPGNFGVAWLVRDKKTEELFAVKYIERGEKIVFYLLVWLTSV